MKNWEKDFRQMFETVVIAPEYLETVLSFIHTQRQEARKEVIDEIKEFRHANRDKTVSSEFDIAFDDFLIEIEEASK